MQAFLFLLTVSLVLATTHALSNVQFRPAASADVYFARRTMFQQAMNPLSISEETLLVAYDEDTQKLVGFGQIRPLTPEFAELASLFVLPEYRTQGIGTALVRELLQRHDASEKEQHLCLLTLRPTVPFYATHGFQVVDNLQDIPAPLQFEYKAGSVVSAFLGNDLVCMVRK